MATWKNYPSDSVVRDENVVKILRLDHAKSVSEFIRTIDDATYLRGYKSLILDFEEVTSNYPNAVVPVAGIIRDCRKLPQSNLTI